MRRHQPAVKLGRKRLGLVSDDQFRIHAHIIERSNRGSLATPPYPLDAPARPPAPEGGLGGPQSIGLAFLRPFRPARCTKCRPAPQNCPCPGLGWGQGTVCLSNERLQLVFIQSCPEFPFDPFGHLLPGAPGGFHLFEDIERFY